MREPNLTSAAVQNSEIIIWDGDLSETWLTPLNKKHLCDKNSDTEHWSTQIRLKQCAAALPCRSGEQMRAVPQTGAGDAGGAGLYVSNERWQETLPAPTHLSLLLRLHAHTQHLKSPHSPQMITLFSLNHSLALVLMTGAQPPRSSTTQNCLAQKQDQCIIQMTVKALYTSFMWISSSWLEENSCRYLNFVLLSGTLKDHHAVFLTIKCWCF